MARASEEARAIVKEDREVSREVQEELKTLSRLESMGERTAGFDRNRRRLKELERKNRETIKREVSREPVDPDKLSLGDRVKILTLNQNAEVISLPDEKDVYKRQGVSLQPCTLPRFSPFIGFCGVLFYISLRK